MIILSITGQERQLPIAQGSAASGASGLNYANTQAGSENHNKKNFGLNYSSDQGSSTNYGQTGLQAAAAGGVAQGSGPAYPGYPVQYPGYPGYPYPHYPQYPGVGYPNLGVGSGVQLPGVGANSHGVVGGYPRYYL